MGDVKRSNMDAVLDQKAEISLYQVAVALHLVVAGYIVIEDIEMVEHTFYPGLIQQAANGAAGRALQAVKLIYCFIEEAEIDADRWYFIYDLLRGIDDLVQCYICTVKSFNKFHLYQEGLFMCIVVIKLPVGAEHAGKRRVVVKCIVFELEDEEWIADVFLGKGYPARIKAFLLQYTGYLVQHCRVVAVQIFFVAVLVCEVMLVEEAGLGAIKYRVQVSFIGGFINRAVKALLQAQVVRYAEKIAFADMEGADVIFKSAAFGLIRVAYPHYSLQW